MSSLANPTDNHTVQFSGLTQRRINLGLLTLATIGGIFSTLNAFVRLGLDSRTFGYLIGTLVSIALLAAYWKGWEPARAAMVVVITLLVGIFTREPHLTERLSNEVFFPMVCALVLTGPRGVAGASIGMLLILGLRTGMSGIYFKLGTLISYFLIAGCMILSRLASDNLLRLAESNQRAAQAQAEAEARARELEERNAELQALLHTIDRQDELIAEISVPLLPLDDQTLVMPLIGAFDSDRLRQAQATALERIYAVAARRLILDVSGVAVLDSTVARGLLDLVSAVRLLGTRVILVGIRQEVAATLANLGLDLSAVEVRRDVQAALAGLSTPMPR